MSTLQSQYSYYSLDNNIVRFAMHQYWCYNIVGLTSSLHLTSVSIVPIIVEQVGSVHDIMFNIYSGQIPVSIWCTQLKASCMQHGMLVYIDAHQSSGVYAYMNLRSISKIMFKNHQHNCMCDRNLMLLLYHSSWHACIQYMQHHAYIVTGIRNWGMMWFLHAA